MQRLVVFVLVALSLATGSALARSRPQTPPSATAVVADLYREFAWSALFAPDPALRGPRWEVVSQQPGKILGRYFEPGLVRLLLQDRACAVRTHGVCNLDFDPIFGVQDSAGASDLSIVGVSEDRVAVSIRYPSLPEPMKLSYMVKHAPTGWRIFDIAYPDGTSLRQLLSRH